MGRVQSPQKELVMKTKYEDMGDRPFLLVPVFDERVRNCPLDSVGALVYGYLLFLRRNKKPDRRCVCRTRIGLSLRLDKKAVDKAVRGLIEGGLVVEAAGRVQAAEPRDDSPCWFRRQARWKGEWYEGFVYDRVFLPHSSTTLSVKTNHLFWHLVRIGFPLQCMPGYHMAGGHPNEPPRYLTREYLARGLNCCPRTVSRGLERLRQLRLISIQQLSRNRFVVGIPPINESAVLWRDEWKKTSRESEVTPEVTARSLFAVPSAERLTPADETQKEVWLFARSQGIRGKLLEEIITKVVKYRVSPREWKPLLKLAAKIHAENKEKDPERFSASHCGFLFKTMLEDLIEQQAAHKEVVGEYLGRPESLPEMESRLYMANLRMTPMANRLVRRAVTEEQLPLRNGGCVPCRIGWDDVYEITKVAKKDYEMFRHRIASRIFDFGQGNVDCEWYDAWMSQEQIPEWNDSPLVRLGLRPSDFDRLRGVAEKLVKTVIDHDDVVRIRMAADMLIKSGCDEAAGNTADDLTRAITDVFHRVRAACEKKQGV